MKLTGLIMKYFVLKPIGRSDHARASRAALLKYADEIERYNVDLALDIRVWVANEANKKAPEDVKCAAKSSPTLTDCDWPFCGCDPKASRVIEELEEIGWGHIEPIDIKRFKRIENDPTIEGADGDKLWLIHWIKKVLQMNRRY